MKKREGKEEGEGEKGGREGRRRGRKENEEREGSWCPSPPSLTTPAYITLYKNGCWGSCLKVLRARGGGRGELPSPRPLLSSLLHFLSSYPLSLIFFSFIAIVFVPFFSSLIYLHSRKNRDAQALEALPACALGDETARDSVCTPSSTPSH